MSTSCFRQRELPALTIRAKQCAHPLRLSEQQLSLFNAHKGNSFPLFRHWLLITPNSLNVSCIPTNNDTAELKEKHFFNPMCSTTAKPVAHVWLCVVSLQFPLNLGSSSWECWGLYTSSFNLQTPLYFPELAYLLCFCRCCRAGWRCKYKYTHTRVMHVVLAHTVSVVSLFTMTSHRQTQCSRRKPCGDSFYCL